MSKCHIVGKHMLRLICHSVRSNKDELYIFKIVFKSFTPDNRQSKVNTIDERRSKIVRNRVFDCHLSPDFSIVICRPTGDKWQSKTLFLAISICIKQHVFVTCYICVLIKTDTCSFPFL